MRRSADLTKIPVHCNGNASEARVSNQSIQSLHQSIEVIRIIGRTTIRRSKVQFVASIWKDLRLRNIFSSTYDTGRIV